MLAKVVLILEGTLAVGAVDVHLAIMLLEPRVGIEYLYITSQHECPIAEGINT